MGGVVFYLPAGDGSDAHSINNLWEVVKPQWSQWYSYIVCTLMEKTENIKRRRR